MAQAMAAMTAAVEAAVKVKLFHLGALLLGGDGAQVRVHARENKKGEFNVSVAFKEPGVKAQVGCTDKLKTVDEARAAFEKLVATALAHGFVKKERKVRAPKAPAFTVETFPTAKPFGAGVTVDTLLFPKKGAVKKGAAKKAAKK